MVLSNSLTEGLNNYIEIQTIDQILALPLKGLEPGFWELRLKQVFGS